MVLMLLTVGFDVLTGGFDGFDVLTGGFDVLTAGFDDFDRRFLFLKAVF